MQWAEPINENVLSFSELSGYPGNFVIIFADECMTIVGCKIHNSGNHLKSAWNIQLGGEDANIAFGIVFDIRHFASHDVPSQVW